MSLRRFYNRIVADSVLVPAIGVDSIATYYAEDAIYDSSFNVLSWPPRVGNPLNVLSTPDPARRPTFGLVTGFGNTPAIISNGTQGLSNDSFYLPVGVTDIAMLVVYRVRSLSAANTIVAFGSVAVGPGSGTGGVSLSHGNPLLALATYGNVGVNRQRYSNSGGTYLNKWVRAGGMGYLSDPNPETATYVNGVVGAQSSAFVADNTSYFNNVTRIYVGHYGYTNTFLTGDISEIHIYPRLTTAQFLDLDAQVASNYPPFP